MRHSERMLWRKLVDRDPRWVRFADKLAAKEYVKERCPDLALPTVLWTGTDANAIPDALLRGDVYVKTNHASGFNIRVRDGDADRQKLKETTDKWLATSYGVRDGEWAYGKVERRLFVEESIGDVDTDMLEFQVRAGDGKCILGSVMGHAKTSRQWVVYLDEDGVPVRQVPGKAKGLRATLPEGLDIRAPYLEAVRHTRSLSKGVDYARFDFLWNGTTLYGGEITMYPGAGIGEITDPAMSAATMSGWRLECSWFLSTRQPWPASLYANALRRRLAEG